VFWRGDEREFAGWYINFQEPYRRWEGGYDTQDLELDIWIPRDGPWEWKDREALEERVREGRFTAEQAAHVRAEADKLAADLDAGRWWWDTSWSEWSPAS
jgi:predicted RNA-binding protein associated with RNAse of E/G family